MDISFPIASRRSSMFPEGNVPGYVCNPGSPRERDAASQGHTSGIPTRAMLHSWKLAPAAHHVLLSILVMTSPAPGVWPSILTDYTYDSELDNADGVPHSVSTQRLVPSGNQGYIRNLGRFVSPDINIPGFIQHTVSPMNSTWDVIVIHYYCLSCYIKSTLQKCINASHVSFLFTCHELK